ncbi:MAG TPA: hypothetical protein VFZ00_07870, partial [Solirubrobacter sp.]|nr:hypothetical protein [Solirubrobacter sp.]
MPGGDLIVRDRPIAAILAALAATMFVAAFAAAAVTRPDSSSTPAATRTAPATAQENPNVATLSAPAFSRVAALPALHLPKNKPVKKKSKPKTSAPAAPNVSTPAPSVSPPPAATAAPPVRRTVAPPPQRKPSSVGQTFDS